ncbi:hypothetical protein [Brevibacillus sp. 179-C9.3 HS]|uniref:hypothetical protein n=1 Tax=unclassified Brevibacillus TaxID=2684853 RepID=UPI0039A1A9ED
MTLIAAMVETINPFIVVEAVTVAVPLVGGVAVSDAEKRPFIIGTVGGTDTDPIPASIAVKSTNPAITGSPEHDTIPSIRNSHGLPVAEIVIVIVGWHGGRGQLIITVAMADILTPFTVVDAVTVAIPIVGGTAEKEVVKRPFTMGTLAGTDTEPIPANTAVKATKPKATGSPAQVTVPLRIKSQGKDVELIVILIIGWHGRVGGKIPGH